MLNKKQNSLIRLNKSICLFAFLLIFSLILPSAFSEGINSAVATARTEKISGVSNAVIQAAVNSVNKDISSTNSPVVTSYVEDRKNNSAAKTPAQIVTAPALYDSKINNINIAVSGNSSANFPAEKVGPPVSVSNHIINLSAIPLPRASSNPIAVDTIKPNSASVDVASTPQHFSSAPSSPVKFTEKIQPSAEISSKKFPEKISDSPKAATPSKAESSTNMNSNSDDEAVPSENKGIWFRIKSWFGINGG